MFTDWQEIISHPDEGYSDHFPEWKAFIEQEFKYRYAEATRRYADGMDYYVLGRLPVDEFFGIQIENEFEEDQGIAGLEQDYLSEPTNELTMEEVENELIKELIYELEDLDYGKMDVDE